MHDDHKVNPKKWREAFLKNKRATWVVVTLKNGEEHFITNAKEWMRMKDSCDSQSTFIDKLTLQFKSHRERINIDNCDGLYFAKSIIGILGGKSRETITIGIISDDVVYKTIWNIPELIIERTYDDKESNCFKETLIYDKAKKNRKEQV